MVQDPTEGQAKIGPGNGLVPLGNKPLHEPMWTKAHDGIWHH